NKTPKMQLDHMSRGFKWASSMISLASELANDIDGLEAFSFLDEPPGSAMTELPGSATSTELPGSATTTEPPGSATMTETPP
ncbi:22877_t:CDS:1, partial [Racocetra persica]